LRKTAKKELKMNFAQSQKLLETAFKMLEILKKAIEEKTRLPKFRPEDSGFEIVETDPAKDIEQSLHSIGVWLYQNITGESEWSKPKAFYTNQARYEEIAEDHDLAKIVNPLIVEFHGLGLEEVFEIAGKVKVEIEEKARQARRARQVRQVQEIVNAVLELWGKIKFPGFGPDFLSAEIFCFQIPIRSKRGTRFEKTAGNDGSVVDANQNYLMPEIKLTPPHEAIQRLVEMFPHLNADNWEQALRKSIEPAVRACNQYGIDADRLIFFPWIKRPALARIGNQRNLQTMHHGALIESVVFPKLEQLYQQEDLGFYNMRSGEMSANRFLLMKPEFVKWLQSRENEIKGDICFSAVILDLFQGFSVKAVRWEIDHNYLNLIPASCYLTQQLLLTNIQLLSADTHQRWDMPGDLYDYEGSSSFGSALFCDVIDDEFGFDDVFVGSASSVFGSLVFPFGVF